jgi:uncharacterized protein
MPDHFTWLLLCAAAFFGGAVNAIAGGGTLLTFPSLLTVLSPVAANATSTLALMPASLAAGYGLRSELHSVKHHLVRLWPASLIGGIIGSLLVTRLPERVFATAVPILLVTASTLLLLQPPLSRWLASRRVRQGERNEARPSADRADQAPHGPTVMGIIAFQFLVGVYGGYFGAGIGIMMLTALAFAGIPDIHQMNAVKNLLAVTINGVTALVFVLSGAVVWKYSLVMAVASVLGGYTGARVSRKLPVSVVRGIVIAIGFGMALYSWVKMK